MFHDEPDEEFGEHTVANQILYDKEGKVVLVVATGVLKAVAVRDEETLGVLKDILKTLRRMEKHLAVATGERITDGDVE